MQIETTVTDDLAAQAKRLVDWCQYDALPFWAEFGVDPDGGFFETLDLSGHPIPNELRRVRVQARQCYVYAQAAYLEWFDSAKTTANHGWAYLTSQGFQGGRDVGLTGFAGCAHLLEPDGRVNDPWRDTYAQAFVILAASWRYRAFNDAAALDVLHKTVTLLNKEMKADTGWLEGCPPRLPRRQNPHMHLFEAFIAAFNATQDGVFLKKADEIYNLFTSVFFDPQTHMVKEFFNQDWTPDLDTGDLTEPGHMMEWCWLLHSYHKIRPSDQIIDYADKLFHAALKFGLNAQTGLLINETRLSGEPTDADSRCWPQTEFIKAGLARSKFGLNNTDAMTTQIIERLFDYYLDVPKRGGWNDKISTTGEVLSRTMPASTFYHLFCVAAEAHDFLETRNRAD